VNGVLYVFDVTYLLYDCHPPDSNVRTMQRRFAVKFSNTGVKCSPDQYTLDVTNGARYGETWPTYTAGGQVTGGSAIKIDLSGSGTTAVGGGNTTGAGGSNTTDAGGSNTTGAGGSGTTGASSGTASTSGNTSNSGANQTMGGGGGSTHTTGERPKKKTAVHQSTPPAVSQTSGPNSGAPSVSIVIVPGALDALGGHRNGGVDRPFGGAEHPFGGVDRK
jgi:hypothetical protein